MWAGHKKENKGDTPVTPPSCSMISVGRQQGFLVKSHAKWSTHHDLGMYHGTVLRHILSEKVLGIAYVQDKKSKDGFRSLQWRTLHQRLLWCPWLLVVLRKLVLLMYLCQASRPLTTEFAARSPVYTILVSSTQIYTGHKRLHHVNSVGNYASRTRCH